MSEGTVEKRLKLGRVAPAILDAYRAGDIGLEQVQAFALSDDRKAQQRVFAACDGHRADPRTIRRALTAGAIPSTAPRLCFIGLEAYEAAGGPVRRDLFDDATCGYAQDALAESVVPKAGAGTRRARSSATATSTNSAASPRRR